MSTLFNKNSQKAEQLIRASKHSDFNQLLYKVQEAKMKEVLKNIMYAGLGAAFITKEKLEELQKELIEKGKTSQ